MSVFARKKLSIFESWGVHISPVNDHGYLTEAAKGEQKHFYLKQSEVELKEMAGAEALDVGLFFSL